MRITLVFFLDSLAKVMLAPLLLSPFGEVEKMAPTYREHLDSTIPEAISGFAVESLQIGRS